MGLAVILIIRNTQAKATWESDLHSQWEHSWPLCCMWIDHGQPWSIHWIDHAWVMIHGLQHDNINIDKQLIHNFAHLLYSNLNRSCFGHPLCDLSQYRQLSGLCPSSWSLLASDPTQDVHTKIYSIIVSLICTNQKGQWRQSLPSDCAPPGYRCNW